MLSTILLLFLGGFSPSRFTQIAQSELPQRPPPRPLFDSPATAWISPMNDSTEERQMLWDAQYVLYYAGRMTSDPPVFILNGNRIPGRLSRDWYLIDRPRLINPIGLSLVTRPLSERSDRPVVIVLDQDDYQEMEGYQAIEDKVVELEGDGIKQVIVLQRGAKGGFSPLPPSTDSPVRSTLMLYWIADAELTVLFSRDFNSPRSMHPSAFTLDFPIDRGTRAGLVAIIPTSPNSICVISPSSSFASSPRFSMASFTTRSPRASASSISR